MAQWEVTIAQPAGATPAVSPVVLSAFGEDGYKPSYGLAYKLEGRTVGGSGIIEGVTVPYYHSLELTVDHDQAIARELEKLVAWQQRQFDLNQDGRLLITDEFDYTLVWTTPHPKTLLAGSEVSMGTGFSTGFPVWKGIIELPENHRQHNGVAPDGSYGKKISLLIEEVP